LVEGLAKTGEDKIEEITYPLQSARVEELDLANHFSDWLSADDQEWALNSSRAPKYLTPFLGGSGLLYKISPFKLLFRTTSLISF